MKKFENFQRALRNLEEIRKCREPYEMIVLTGQVALFEICFEQSWKAMKEILEYNGYDESRTGSPRSILKLAYQAGMIDNEELWVEALASRNNVSHAYNEGIAAKIVSETKAKYIDMFEALEEKVKSNWISVVTNETDNLAAKTTDCPLFSKPVFLFNPFTRIVIKP